MGSCVSKLQKDDDFNMEESNSEVISYVPPSAGSTSWDIWYQIGLYLDHQFKECQIYHVLPPEAVVKLINNYYDPHFIWNSYNNSEFTTSSEHSIIRPKNKEYDNPNLGGDPRYAAALGAAEGYLMYPTPNGFTKGVHHWTIMYHKNNGYGNGCRVVGVTAIWNEKWTMKGGAHSEWVDQDPDGSQWDGFNIWRVGGKVTIVLDLNDYKVEYYYNGILRKTEEISKKNKKYYFAICASHYHKCATFKSERI